MKSRVLLIGHGAMAQTVLAALPAPAAVDFLLVRSHKVTAVQAQVPAQIQVVSNLAQCTHKPDFALECASHSALSDYGAELLAAGIDLGVISVGALADPTLFEQLQAAALQGGAQLHILAGAVAGIDALAAARAGGLDEVHYTSRKPPASWKNTPAEQMLDLTRLNAATVFYEGTAREAARQYPANANVAATIALAGLGFDKTHVQLIADPAASGNIHHIQACGRFGTLSIELQGQPLPDNPKTSTLAALSALRALINRSGWLVI